MVGAGEVENRGEQIKVFQAESTVHADAQRLQDLRPQHFFGSEVM